MSQRLSRKEIKQDIREDEVRGLLLRAFAFVQEHPSIILGVAGAIVGLVLIVVGAITFFNSRSEAASANLASAIDVFNRPVAQEDSTSDGDEETFASEEERIAEAKQAFEEVRESAASGIAGDVANLYLADIAAAEGDTETARGIWESFLRDHSDHVLAVSVKVNLIHLARQSGQGQEVIEELQQALEAQRKSLPEDLILYELAQTFEELEQKEEALETYQRIIDEHPKSPYTAKARQITTSTS